LNCPKCGEPLEIRVVSTIPQPTSKAPTDPIKPKSIEAVKAALGDDAKYLNFSQEGDTIVIKVKHYLKTEFDRINAAIVGLGGRYIRGVGWEI